MESAAASAGASSSSAASAASAGSSSSSAASAAAAATISAAHLAWVISAADIEEAVAAMKAAEAPAAALGAPLAGEYASALGYSPQQAAVRLAALREYGAPTGASAQERGYAALYKRMRKLRHSVAKASWRSVDRVDPLFSSTATSTQMPIADAAAALGIDAAELAALGADFLQLAMVADGAAPLSARLMHAYQSVLELRAEDAASRLRQLQLAGRVQYPPTPPSALESEYAAQFAPLRAFRADFCRRPVHSRFTAAWLATRESTASSASAAASTAGAAAAATAAASSSSAASGASAAGSVDGGDSSASVTGKRKRADAQAAPAGSITLDTVWDRPAPSREMTVAVSTHPSSTVLSLKEQLEALTGVPAEDQLLTTQDRTPVMDDSLTLADCKLEDGDKLWLEQLRRDTHVLVYVKLYGGRRIALHLARTSTVGAAKAIAHPGEILPPDHVMLTLGDQQLYDFRTLAAAGVTDGATLSIKACSLRLFVSLFAMRTTTYEVLPWMTIRELKDMIDDDEDIPSEHHRLIYAGKLLEDDRTLLDYNIRHESSVLLTGRLLGD